MNTIYCTLICNKGHLRFADAPCVYGRNACEYQNFIGSASFLHLPLYIAFGECADYILKICILQYVKESLENHSKKCSKQKLNTVILT